MPVGPSHGSRGRSRTSSRGFSSSSSSRGYRSGRAPIFYFGGSGTAASISPKTSKIYAIVFGLIFSVLFLLGGLVLIINNAGDKALMQKDANEYAEIISRANAGDEGYYLITIENIENVGESHIGDNAEYVFTGDYNANLSAYGWITRNGVLYFYLEFTFTDSSGNNVTGETYAMYSESAMNGLSEITFAYTKLYDNDGSWDIIDVNYKLVDNIEYLVLQDRVLTGSIVFSLFTLLSVFLIYMWYRVAHDMPIFKKLKTEEKVEVDRKRVCEYCGSFATQTTEKCEACGARKFKEVTIKKKI